MANSDEKIEQCRYHDRLLHQTLSKIFRDGCLTSSQIKERIRATDHNSITHLVLEQEPTLRTDLLDRIFENHTLLWITVFRKYFDSAELLVRSGADVNEVCRNPEESGPDKFTILGFLMTMDNTPENERLIRLVADHGADLNAKAYDGDGTALHYAVCKGRIQSAEILLEKGADVNVADRRGVTPLLAAIVISNADEMVPLLMKHGADVSARRIDGTNVLHLLPYNESINVKQMSDLARAFIEKGTSLDDRAQNDYQYQPIHTAAGIGKYELVKLYLDHGANVNSQAINGQSPLFLAAQHANLEMLETLLKRGANINLPTKHGYTALHASCLYSLEHNISLLLSAGADVLPAEQCDGIHQTPFALVNHQNIKNPSIRLVLKALALKKVCLMQPSIELNDEKIMKENEMQWNYYQDCIANIFRMKFTRFTKSCTFLELLTKSHCQIATLMRDPNFEPNFGLYDLNGFSMYAEDILRAFKRAQNRYHSMIEQEDLINEAVYHIFPYMVVRKVVGYVMNDSVAKI